MLLQVLEDPTAYVGWKELVLALFALLEVGVRLTPSEKDNSIVNKVVMFGTYILDFIVPNRKRNGDRFKLNKNV
jgi:hypothetical protein